MFAERKQKDAEPMPHTVSRGAKIYFEEVGSGIPILCLHEYAGDHRSWRDFVRYFSRGYRCITMSARGYPPSDVPEKDDDYSQELANLVLWPCSTILASRRRTSSATAWARSRPFSSAFMPPSV